MKRPLFLLISLLLLSNCTSMNQYTIGSSTTAAVAGTACYTYLSDNPAVVATCAVAGSFKGADIMNAETDDQLMTRAFVDHLDRNGNTVKSYTLRGVFPTVVAPIELTYDEQTAIEQFDVTFNYQYFESNTTT